jgi:plastocyanin
MRAKRLAVLGAIVLGGLTLAGCGGDDTGETGGNGGGGTTADVVLRGNDALKWDRPTYTAKAGTVTFAVVNDGGQPHTLLFDEKKKFDGTREKLTVTKKGATARGSVDLEPGEYTLYCDVAGHRSAGMIAKLVVE